MGREVKKVPVIPEEQQPEPECHHYWSIEPPNGSFSKGVCRLCGEERQFQNYLGARPWELDDRTSPSDVAAGVGRK